MRSVKRVSTANLVRPSTCAIRRGVPPWSDKWTNSLSSSGVQKRRRGRRRSCIAWDAMVRMFQICRAGKMFASTGVRGLVPIIPLFHQRCLLGGLLREYVRGRTGGAGHNSRMGPRLVMKFKFKFGPRNCQIETHSSKIAKIVSAQKSTFAGNLKFAAPSRAGMLMLTKGVYIACTPVVAR